MKLIERLRDEPRLHEVSNGLNTVEMMVWHNTALEAADTIERLEAELNRVTDRLIERDKKVARLRAALQSIAKTKHQSIYQHPYLTAEAALETDK